MWFTLVLWFLGLRDCGLCLVFAVGGVPLAGGLGLFEVVVLVFLVFVGL